MNLNDMILISVDDHLIEPADLFLKHMPKAMKSRAPRIERSDDKDFWLFEGKAYPSIGLNAVAGRPPEEYGMEPTSYEGMRKGCWDVHSRIDDMNVNGLLASICFPTFGAFAGTTYLAVTDKTVAHAAVQAYNDWHVQDWCGAYPGRFIPMIILPLWDVEGCAAEVRRFAAMGVHAISFPDNPTAVGLPSIHGEHWDPLWKACADNNVVICTHIGSGLAPPHASNDTPIDAWIASFPMSIAGSAADWLYAPLWKKFPNLRLALSEGGIGWVPYLLERSDFTHTRHNAWTNADFGAGMPSDVFKRHFISCFIDDQFGVKNLSDIGEDMVMYECDYPHSDSLWPKAPESLFAGLSGLSDEQINKITHLNAMREFSFDPFQHIDRKNCTVESLRAQAGHVVTSFSPGKSGAARPTDGQLKKPVTSGDIHRMLAAIQS